MGGAMHHGSGNMTAYFLAPQFGCQYGIASGDAIRAIGR
jgi:hypothetical protein